MRKAIDTAPRNGEFVFLEDAARGTIVFARWSAAAGQWLDEKGAPSLLNATHWHAPQNSDDEGTPGQLNASFWHGLSPAAPSGSMAARPQRAASPGSSVSAWARFAGFAGRGCSKVLSRFGLAGGWIVRRRGSFASMA